jgi:hypothetical protein
VLVTVSVWVPVAAVLVWVVADVLVALVAVAVAADVVGGDVVVAVPVSVAVLMFEATTDPVSALDCVCVAVVRPVTALVPVDVRDPELVLLEVALPVELRVAVPVWLFVLEPVAVAVVL